MKIRRWTKRIFFVIFFLTFVFQLTATLEARYPSNPDEACGTACGSFILIIIAFFVLNIAILVWVAKDAKSRGMGSSVGWIFLILFTGVIGLIIYLFSRPKGDLVICEQCKNKKLRVAKACPHCGNTV